ncbi:MAG: HlyC/CorC family transporter [Kiloniellales bacterium]
MTPETLISLAAIVALLLLSALFSGSETSLTAASRARMHTLEQQGNRRAKLVNELWLGKERLIGAILLGNNFVNITASALATGVMIDFFGDAGVAYATLVMTAVIVIFSEVMPKTYAIHHADRTSLAVAPVMRWLVWLLFPVTHAVHVVVRAALRLFGVQMSAHLSPEGAAEELRGAIELHASAGKEDRHERQMMRSILDLADVEVSEIMIHRKNVVMLDIDQPPAANVEAMLASPHTRLPLWRGTTDNIVGVLHAKALFRAVKADPQGIERLDIGSLASPPWFVPETTDLLVQLQAFRSRHEHFAIVVDEYGEVLGIVTLEDILEEIVGEISDEHDVELEGVKLQSDGSVLVDGRVTIRDLNRQFDWKLRDEEASTVAGLILHEARRIPEVNQVFAFHGLRFQILGRQRNQITWIRIMPLGEGGN